MGNQQEERVVPIISLNLGRGKVIAGTGGSVVRGMRGGALKRKGRCTL